MKAEMSQVLFNPNMREFRWIKLVKVHVHLSAVRSPTIRQEQLERITLFAALQAVSVALTVLDRG